MISQTVIPSDTEMPSGSEAVEVWVDKKYEARDRECPYSLIYKGIFFPLKNKKKKKKENNWKKLLEIYIS